MHIPSPLSLSRREMLAASAASAAAFITTPTLMALQAAVQPDGAGDTAEDIAKELFASLQDTQRQTLAMSADHALRARVANNWKITDNTIGEILTDSQKTLAQRTFELLHHQDSRESVMGQVVQDNGKFENASLAFFGTPENLDNTENNDGFELVFAGRHITRRLELGPQASRTALGGPVFYGHAAGGFNEAPDHPGNAYWDSSLKANTLYQALNQDQQVQALTTDDRADNDQLLVAEAAGAIAAGLSCGVLNDEQRVLLNDTINGLLSPFRTTDQDHARSILQANGGIDALQLAYFSNQDVGDDGVWDSWQIKGPGFTWYFRGDPHVHVWGKVEEI